MKTLYLLFDHEWQFKHCEISSKEDYETALKEGSNHQEIKNAYSKDLDNERNHWYLDQISMDEYYMSNKMSNACQKCQVRDTTLNNVINTFTNSENYKTDIYGNCIVKVDVADEDYDKIKGRLEKLCELDHMSNKHSNIAGGKKDLGRICSESEKTLDAQEAPVR